MPGYSSADSTHQQFTGQIRDAETNLDYFNARYYSSAHGRFTSPDPLMASASAIRPQSWNRYSYCLNNPMNLTDPSGMVARAASEPVAIRSVGPGIYGNIE